MIYNFHYDICALAIYLFTLFCVLRKKGMRKLPNKVFLVILLIGCISSIFDILASISNSYVTEYPLWLRSFFNYSYMTVHCALPVMFNYYINAVFCPSSYRRRKPLVILSLPFYSCLLVLALNPVFNWVFRYDEALLYQLGPMIAWFHVCTLFYLAGCIYFILKYRDSAAGSKWWVVLYYVAAYIGSIFIQALFPSLLLELFIQAIILLGILVTIENDSDTISSLTGIYNKRAFLQENRSSLENKTRYTVIALKLMNLEDFRLALGAIRLSQVQREIAQWLDQLVPGCNAYDCESGKFALMVYRSGRQSVSAITEQIQERFSQDWLFQDMSIPLNVQVCVIRVPHDVNTLEHLFTMIETNYGFPDRRVTLIHEEQLQHFQRELEVEQAIQRALANNSLQVYFQPIWSSKTRHICAAEALTRLYDDRLGMVPPDEFIPIAERTGAITQISDYVLHQTCQLLSHKEFAKLGILYIDINLSPVQLMQRNLTGHLQSILDQYGVAASSINLEITESAALSSSESLLQTIRQLKKLGFSFSMDDYGTGYSNFANLLTLNFDVIKLDKSFLWDADTKKPVRIILENSVRMLKEMDLKILVEGVETRKQLEYVTSLGFDYCQGYYFSRPVQRDEFIEYCRNYNQ